MSKYTQCKNCGNSSEGDTIYSCRKCGKVYCASCAGPGIPFIGVWCPRVSCGGDGNSIGEIESGSADEDDESEDDDNEASENDEDSDFVDVEISHIEDYVAKHFDDDVKEAFYASKLPAFIEGMLSDRLSPHMKSVFKKYIFTKAFIVGWNARGK